METKIISFYTQKGGSGKTTLTHLMGIALSAKEVGKKVLVVDSDPQRSLMKILEDIRMSNEDPKLKPPYDLVYSPIGEIRDTLRKHHGKYDIILIDMPGTLDMKGVRSGLLACDVVFIPIQPSQLDFVSSRETIEKIKEIQQLKKSEKEDFHYYCLVNQAEPKKVRTRELLEYIGASKIPHLEVPVLRYEKYKDMMNEYSVDIFKKKNWGNEELALRKVFDEILEKLN
ncbi:MAG: ParA family protein [Bacteroidetes bacterium]|nr:ParA family protein [Bacteroidota bacterium]